MPNPSLGLTAVKLGLGVEKGLVGGVHFSQGECGQGAAGATKYALPSGSVPSGEKGLLP